MAEKTSKEMIVRRRVAPTLLQELPQAEDIKVGRDQVLFGKGQWLPSLDPLVIGKENFADLQNLRYGNDGLDTIKGHAKINAAALTTYLKGRAMHQLVTPYTTPSRILVQAFNTGLTAAQILQNLSVVPAAADFETEALDTTAPAIGRFAKWPSGHVAFCDGATVKVWAGDEMPVSFISLSTHIGFHDEYTQYLRNTDITDAIPLQISALCQIPTGTPTGSPTRDLTGNGAAGQAFAARFAAGRNGSVQAVEIKLYRVGTPAGNLVAKIYAATGTYPDDYPDSAALLGTSAAVSCAALPTGTDTFVAFVFASLPALSSGTNYWIVITADADYVYSDGVTEVVLPSKTYATAYKALDKMDAAGTWNHKPAADEYITARVQYKVYVYLAVSRPAQGFQVNINAAYANENAAALVVENATYSAGTIAFTGMSVSDLTVTTGKTMAKAGKVTASGGAASAPIFINGMSLYWYRLSFSAFLSTGAAIYQILADCAWQAVKSLWSGESMILTGFKIFDGAKNQDYTSYMNDESQTTGTETQLDAFATSKKIYIQTASPAQGFMFRFIPGSYNTSAAVMQIKRYQGSFVTITNFVDKTSLSGASFGVNGMVAFDVDELDKTLSLDGETPYYTYEITFSAALASDVELYNVTAIEAPKTIDGYVFPFMFRNRPLLCAYTKGEEGNRVDFGMTDTVDVFTGSDASLGMNNAPLYFGGNEALTGAIEMYNRLGSTIYHVGVFCKAQETYLLSGYDAETYQIYRISGAIGSPAPMTMDTVEIGYGADQQAELRCIALWLSFVGPVICDTATVTPVPGVECYFDRNDSRCINWSAVEKACGVVDLEFLEYHLCIPSGVGQTTNNVWLVFDLMKHRWYRRVANDGNYPQAFCRVVSANGTPYVYACYDGGSMRRINTGDTWDAGGTAIACVLKVADILPTGDMWDATRLRYFKLLAAVAAAVSVALTHYKNGAAAGTSLTAAALVATNRHSRHVQPVGILAWSHQMLLTFNAPTGGATLIGMAYEFTVEREDLTSGAGG